MRRARPTQPPRARRRRRPPKSAIHSRTTGQQRSRMIGPVTSTRLHAVTEGDRELDDLAAQAHDAIRHLDLEAYPSPRPIRSSSARALRRDTRGSGCRVVDRQAQHAGRVAVPHVTTHRRRRGQFNVMPTDVPAADRDVGAVLDDAMSAGSEAGSCERSASSARTLRPLPTAARRPNR